MIPVRPPPPHDPAPPKPVRSKAHGVVASTPVNPDERRKDGDGRPQQRRRGAIDFLLDEIDALPGLGEAQRESLRRNLHDFAQRRHREAGQVPDIPSEPLRLDHAVAALAPGYQDHHPEDEREEMLRLEGELRRCLEIHTDSARKIGQYLHALISQGHETHLVELDV